MGILCLILKLTVLELSTLAFLLERTEDVKHSTLLEFVKNHLVLQPLIIVWDNVVNYEEINDILNISSSRYIFTTGYFGRVRLPLSYRHYRPNVLLYTRNIEQLEKFINSDDYIEKVLEENSHQKFLVLFQKKQQVEAVVTAFQLLWQLEIYNAVVFVNYTKCFTWYPYDEESFCAKYIKPVDCNSNPYENKLHKWFNHCNFSLSWAQARFMISDTENNQYGGVIINFLYTLSSLLGFKIDFMPEGRNTFEDYTLDKKNRTKLIGDMIDQRIDIAFTIGFTLASRNDKYSLTTPLFMTSCGYILPRNQRLNSSSEVIFSLPMWGSIILSIALATFFNKILLRKNVFEAMFKAIQFHFQVVVLKGHGKAYLKIILAGFLLYLILWNTMFSSILSSSLTKPVYKAAPKTLVDLVKSEFFIMSYYNLSEFIGYDVYKLKPKNMIKMVRTHFLDIVAEYLSHDTYSISACEYQTNYFKNKPQVKWLSEKIKTTPFSLLVRNSFPLREALEYRILTIRETNLHMKWLYDYSRYVKKYVARTNPEFEIVALRIEHLYWGFVLFLGGILLSFLAFTAEIIVYNYKFRNLYNKNYCP